MLSIRPMAVALTALAVTSLAGCVPTVWLPDSSGFIYVKAIKIAGEPSGQLLHYDLQKKTSRVIVQDIGKATVWPALSPDGKRIAVGRMGGGPKQAKTMQIVLYDIQGKQLKMSPVFSWSPPPKDIGFDAPVMLFWSPKDDRLVLTDGNVSGLYDVKKDSLKVFDKSMPVIHGGSPIRPDGKGCLLLLGEDKNQRLVLMDWEGTEQKIDVEAIGKVFKDNSPDKNPVSGVAVAALLLPSWWDGTSAWVGFKRDKMTYNIDTVKNRVDFTESLEALVKSKKQIFQDMPVSFDFAGDVSVKVSQFKDGQRSFSKVALVNHKTKKETMLLDKGPQMSLFLPSPDGNYLSLCLTDFQPGEEDLILVISQKGEVVSKLALPR